MKLPSWLIALDEPAIPTVWPLRGTVDSLGKHYYGGGSTEFPPPGMMLEVACMSQPPEAPLGPCDLRLKTSRKWRSGWPAPKNIGQTRRLAGDAPACRRA